MTGVGKELAGLSIRLEKRAPIMLLLGDIPNKCQLALGLPSTPDSLQNKCCTEVVGITAPSFAASLFELPS